MSTIPGARSFWAREYWAREAPLIALVLLALVLRAAVLWTLGSRLAEDRDNYRRIAGRLATGEGYLDPDARTPTAYRPPLYPLLLASVLFCGGSAFSIGVVQIILGTATVGVTVLAGRRLRLGRASYIAGLLVAVDPLLLSQTVLVMTETLAAFLGALLLLLSLAPQPPGPPSRRRAFALGVVFGLCCLCRPAFWAYGALAAVIGALVQCRSCLTGPPRSEPCWHAPLLVAAGLALAVVPWVLRNALVMGRPIVTTTHGGYTLLLAHNPAYTRAVVKQPWGAVWEGDALRAWQASLEAEMSQEDPPIDITHLSPRVELARDKWMNQRAWNYIRSKPRIALLAGATLLGRFWNIAPMETKHAPLPYSVRTAIGVFYAAELLAMLVGLMRVVRPDWRSWWPLLALLAGFTLVHSVYWADMRMRAPLVPAIALLAAASVRRVQQRDLSISV